MIGMMVRQQNRAQTQASAFERAAYRRSFARIDDDCIAGRVREQPDVVVGKCWQRYEGHGLREYSQRFRGLR